MLPNEVTREFLNLFQATEIEYQQHWDGWTGRISISEFFRRRILKVKVPIRYFSLLWRSYCTQTYLVIYRPFNVSRIDVQRFHFPFRNQQRNAEQSEKRQTDNTGGSRNVRFRGRENTKQTQRITRLRVNIDGWPETIESWLDLFSYIYTLKQKRS